MILRSLKIASISGHRWAGIFRRLSAKFAQVWRNSPNSIRSKVDVYEGFIAKHSLIGGRVTTRVVEPNGYLLGFTAGPNDEVGFAGSIASTYLWPTYQRDVFAPGLPIPDDLEPRPPPGDTLTLRNTSTLYGGQAFPYGTPWPSYPGASAYIAAGAVTDTYGFGVSSLISDTQDISTGPDHATIYASARLGAQHEWIIAKRAPASRIAVPWFEDGVSAFMSGYLLAPRMVPTSTAGGSGLPLNVRIPRQIAQPSSVRDDGRMAGCFTVSTSPTRTDFEYACGTTGIIMSFFSYLKNGLATASSWDAYANTLLPPGVEVEQWDDAKPWVQEFTTIETVSWFNPDEEVGEDIEVEVTHKVIYPVGGTYKKAEIPFHDHMPNNLGIPMMVQFEDRVEVYVDYRITRTWVDERPDIYPGLTPVTMQTQTGITKITVPYTIDYVEHTSNVGSMSNTEQVLDTSGAVENCYVDLGGDREDFHRLYRIRWAGNVGGRAVVLASMIKHKRWEEPATGAMPDGGPVIPALAAAVIRQTAQSGINQGHSVTWEYSYETPDAATVNGSKSWTLDCVRIPGDGDAGEWQDAVGVVMIVDGVITEWDAKAIGWCLLREPTEQRVREDDWRWEVTAHKWATAISDTEIALCAYDFPNTPGAPVCHLLKIDVVSGSIATIRTDTLPSPNSRPAINCYQREVVTDSNTTPPCLIYRLGNQNEFGGWMELSKDGGATWVRIWEGMASPGMGATYVGSAIWTPKHGDIFRDYL